MKAPLQYQPLVQPKTTTSSSGWSTTSQPFFSKTGSSILRKAEKTPFFKARIQTKLSVGRADDRFEREADATADRVMRMPAPASPSTAFSNAPGLLQTKTEDKEKKDIRRKTADAEPPVIRLKTDEDEKKKLRRKSESAAPPLTSGFESQLSASQSGGQPLSADTRQFMEPRFGTDFSAVRIHTDTPAVQMSQNIGAQAFAYQNHVYFNEGKYNPATSAGQHLLAHELTHVVQQGGAVQRTPAISTATPSVQRFFGLDVAGTIDGWLDVLPGWRLLTVLIGYNPVLQRNIPRTTANLIEGFLKLGGPIGVLLFNKLRNDGIIGRAAGWIDTQVASLGISFSYIRGLFSQAWDAMGISLGINGNLDIIRRAFAPPFNRMLAFVGRVMNQVVTFIKETIVRPLSNRAKQLRGFPLLTVIIGKDPFTDEVVERSPTNLVRGFMSLMENGDERFQQMQQSGALQRAFTWFNQETTRRNLTWERIKGVFLAAWNVLSPEAVLQPFETISRIAGLFQSLASDIAGFAGAALLQMLEFIFEAVMGAGGARVLAILKRARATFLIIIRDPVRFVGNLVRAGVQGFRQFMQNALAHLQRGLVGWLLGALEGAGLQLPQTFNLQGILSLVLQILGITYQSIRAKLVRATSEQFVSRLEQVFDFLRILITQGPAAAWQKIVEYLGNLRNMVLDGVIGWVRQTVIGQAIIRIASMLNPAGAVIQAIMATYNTVMFFIERSNQIAAVVESYVDSVSAIAAGNVTAAANRVEETMGRTVPVMISFLARLMGLGGISNTIRTTIGRIRQPVDRALDRVVDWVVAQGRRLVGAGREAVGTVFNFFGIRTRFTTESGESHSLYFTQRNRQTVLIIESDPQIISDFINFYVDRYQIQASHPKHRLVQPILNHLTNCTTLQRRIDLLPANSSTRRRLETESLANNIILSGMLRDLLQGNRSIGQLIDSYQLEGLTGTYASMPRAQADILTPDHQPQAAILQWAANLKVGRRNLFRSSSEMARRASGSHANHGYAINLHEIRHIAGRTFGSKGSATLSEFVGRVVPRLNVTSNDPSNDQQKRNIIVDEMKQELRQDVGAMNRVLNRNDVWTDINDITDIPVSERQTLKNGIINRTQRGLREISNQPMEILKDR